VTWRSSLCYNYRKHSTFQLSPGKLSSNSFPFSLRRPAFLAVKLFDASATPTPSPRCRGRYLRREFRPSSSLEEKIYEAGLYPNLSPFISSSLTLITRVGNFLGILTSKLLFLSRGNSRIPIISSPILFRADEQVVNDTNSRAETDARINVNEEKTRKREREREKGKMKLEESKRRMFAAFAIAVKYDSRTTQRATRNSRTH